ncbi:MAG: DUF4373 domain-containing protein [Bacteroidaceae bacterium]|nr:DUF4373 domain-containing protein [Bacteroidaceae bacterium]
MKKDQYIPHEVSMRNTSEVMNLIEKEGMAGYGIYWALMEYLRTQDDYKGDVRVLKSLARQLKTSIDRLMRILNSYGLFEVTDYTFLSLKLNSAMKPLEDKRKAMGARPDDDRRTTVQRNARNNLKISDDVSLSKVKESKGKKSKEENTSSTPAWERYVDELQQEQQWQELMAIRCGLKKQFFALYPRIVESFKNHVRSIGKEGHILSLSDAKHYFCFYLDPGSITFKRMVEELQKPVDKGVYRYEDRHPSAGPRSYCGVPIPPEAPPRPNNQAVWTGEEWFY